VTTNTGLGDPSKATADKGKRLMEIIVERLSSFLVELAAAPLDETFPY
jgi:creatinine amidohydrolase